MNEYDFHRLGNAALESFEETLEEADARGALDMEYENGAITIRLPSGKSWLISKHTPNRQIWLASPVSGGLHFSYDAAKKQWLLPDGRELAAILSDELKAVGQIIM